MKISTGSDFSGVGAFDYAITRSCDKFNIKHHRKYACDIDKFSRTSYISTHGEPEYYPQDVYEREITVDPLDIYMTSPPCQSFSIAGKRLGKDDERGILFFNSWEFIDKNRPRFFIFENVKGLLSDDSGRTFQEWTSMLGGKTINKLKPMIPYEKSVPYHIYWKVVNAKDYGIPQNRERVFIVGIRDDEDNSFSWPKEEPLTKRLKDILETEVDTKYFLSEKAVDWILSHREKRDSKNKFPLDREDIGSCVTARYFKQGAEDPYIKVSTNKGEGIKVMQINPSKESGGKQPYQGNRIYSKDGLSPALNAQNGGKGKGSIMTLDGFSIRRLTPLECFRLMGFPDSHVQKCREAKVSDSQLYKQAGNSIVVDVLEKITDRIVEIIVNNK